MRTLQLLFSAIHKLLPEAWFEQLNSYRGLLERMCDRRIAEVSDNP